MAVVDTEKLVDGERLRMAVQAFREAADKGLTREKLAEAMGHVGLRTADRARKLLYDQGAVFEVRSEPRTREKIFVMKKGPRWDEGISRETRLALRVAAMALGHGGNAILEKQLEVLEQIIDKTLTDKDRKVLERLRRNIRVRGGVAEQAGDDQVVVLGKIFDSFSADIPRQLELDYQRAGASAPRKILFSPYCLTQDLFGGGTFLVGEEADTHKVMQVRLSRIKGIKIVNRPVIFLKEEKLKRAAEHQIGGWIKTDEPFEVRLRVTGTNWIQAMDEARPDLPEFKIERRGTHAIISFRANAPEGLIRWILQFGQFAEVLGPEALRVKVKEASEAMARMYR
jgi:predicted DNA-binding transcriptional regulator YafY